MSVISKLERAKKAALTGDSPNFKHAAVIFKGRRIISIGINKFKKTSPNSTTRSYCQHAEYSAIGRMEPKDTKGCSMLVIRMKCSGSIGLSKPCDECQVMLSKYNFKAIYYTTDDGLIEEL
jgi:deoxycytidylate deaminase